MLPALLGLCARHEKLDMSVTLRDRAVDMVGEGIDLAVRIGALGDHPDLVARRLGEQKLVICAAPAYLERRGVPLVHADLYRHDCLVGWRRGNRPMWLLKNGQGQTEPHEVPMRHEFFDGDALETACIAGCGLAQLPTWLACEALRSGALVQVLSDLTGGAMPIHVVWQKTWHLQPKVRVTVDELVRVAAETPAVFSAGDLAPVSK